MTQSSIPSGEPPLDGASGELRTLSMLWYLVAGLQAIVSGIGLIYVIVGVVFTIMGLSGKSPDGGGDDSTIFAGVGVAVSCFGLFLTALLGGIAFLSFRCGRAYARRRRSKLHYVMAVIACLFFPLGTALGIYTLVVLSRPGVKANLT